MEIIWQSKLDGKYDCKVVRKGDRLATLNISEGKETLFTKEVGLSYGAMFGPDMADVQEWQTCCLEFADSRK